MLKVGLTGGIGSGKSTISNFLRARGIKVIDADKISREVLLLYPQILENIKKEFGEECFDEDNTLNRKKLGSIVFACKDKKLALENIMLPFIKKEIFIRLDKYNEEGEKISVVDAPTLIENNLHVYMDHNILVYVDLETQIERVMQRDMLAQDEIINRINSQLSLESKMTYVDFVVDNNGSIEAAEEKIISIIEELINLKSK